MLNDGQLNKALDKVQYRPSGRKRKAPGNSSGGDEPWASNSASTGRIVRGGKLCYGVN